MKPHEIREQIDCFYGSPLQVISDCLRGFLIAEPGMRFIVNDFSSIEARVLPWLAGEYKVLEIFKGDGKIYEHAASGIYRVPIEEVTADQRQLGKVAILSLGFQGGVGALQAMCKMFNLTLEPAFDGLWQAASLEHRQKACAAYDKRDKRRLGYLSKKEYVASDLVKLAWREANPNIVKFWNMLEYAALSAVTNPGTVFPAGEKIRFVQKGSFLLCYLPSGRFLCYPYPKVEEIKTPWGQTKSAVTFMAEESLSRIWKRHKTYGGFFAENCTQGVARDILAEAMLRLEDASYEIVAHVHDEVVSEVSEDFGSVEEMGKIMCETPNWAVGLPLASGGWSGKRYRKG